MERIVFEPAPSPEPVTEFDTKPAAETEETAPAASHEFPAESSGEETASTAGVGVETPERGEEASWEGPIPTFQAPVEPAPAPGAWVTAADLGGEEEAREEEERDEQPDSGPNWMMAFVLGWAGAAALYEWPSVMRAQVDNVELTHMDRILGSWGFFTLGIGLILFAIEALWWGRRRRSLFLTLVMVLATLLTLGGVVCLFLSKYPGSRI
ncbi:MAG: hypothetical protein ACK47B_05490 [Armatimonadota bacterium]